MQNPEITTFNPDGLVIHGVDLVAQPVTILSGEVLVRGELVGKVTAGGKYIASLSAAADGSEVPAGFVAEDIDASGGDQVAPIYFGGAFDADKLTLGADHTATTVEAAFRAASAPLYIRTRHPR